MEQELEIWKKVPKLPYEASNCGNIRLSQHRSSCDKGMLIKFRNINSKLKKPYLGTVSKINGKSRTLLKHRLVASAWLGKKKSRQNICFIDGNHENCRPDNLVYKTHIECMQMWAENRPNTKITAEVVREMRSMKRAGERIRDIAKKFGISEKTTSAICRNRSWKRIK